MTTSALTGWLSLVLIPLSAISGWVLRRYAKGSFLLRMRPHLVIGYGALAFAIVHLMMSLGGLSGSNATGIWWASFAVGGLALQAFVGINLQAPGGYRLVLRRWHVVTFYVTLVLVFGHIFLNAAFIPQSETP